MAFWDGWKSYLLLTRPNQKWEELTAGRREPRNQKSYNKLKMKRLIERIYLLIKKTGF